jgi:hypothetical protein
MEPALVEKVAHVLLKTVPAVKMEHAHAVQVVIVLDQVMVLKELVLVVV